MQLNKFFITLLCFGAGLAIHEVRAEQSKPLKVCAAEDEMPYSNKAGEGFENKLAELVGKALGRKVEYLHWKCDNQWCFYCCDLLKQVGRCK